MINDDDDDDDDNDSWWCAGPKLNPRRGRLTGQRAQLWFTAMRWERGVHTCANQCKALEQCNTWDGRGVRANQCNAMGGQHIVQTSARRCSSFQCTALTLEIIVQTCTSSVLWESTKLCTVYCISLQCTVLPWKWDMFNKVQVSKELVEPTLHIYLHTLWCTSFKCWAVCQCCD